MNIANASKAELAGIAMLVTSAPFLAVGVHQGYDAHVEGKAAHWEWDKQVDNGFVEPQYKHEFEGAISDVSSSHITLVEPAYIEETDVALTNFLTGCAISLGGLAVFTVTNLKREIRQLDEQAGITTGRGEPK